MEKLLDPKYLCRANRTYIITRKAVNHWQRQADRRVHLELQPQTDEKVKVSRDKTGLVTSWLKGDYKNGFIV